MGREGKGETSGALMKYNNSLPPTYPSPAAQSFIAGDGVLFQPLQHQKHPAHIELAFHSVCLLYVFSYERPACASACMFWMCYILKCNLNIFCRWVASAWRPHLQGVLCGIYNFVSMTPHLFHILLSCFSHFCITCVLWTSGVSLHVWRYLVCPEFHGSELLYLF